MSRIITRTDDDGIITGLDTIPEDVVRKVEVKEVVVITHLRGSGTSDDLLREVESIYDLETGLKIGEHDCCHEF